MDYANLAARILKEIGGPQNVQSIAHCATRLRFVLKDESVANTEKLKNTSGILGVVQSGGQYQIIIGSEVGKVYDPINKACDQNLGVTTDDTPNEKQNLLNRFISMISGVFAPVLPAISAAGMLKAVLALLVTFKWVSPTSQSYEIINFMADAAFYFLPVLLANSAAKRFKCNSYLAMMLAGILLHPTFISLVTTAKEKGDMLHLFGVPIYNATYSSTVIPIILAVWVMSYVERFAEKISPKMLKMFLVPLITVMVSGSLVLVILGPIGYIVGNWIATGILFLEGTVGWLLPIILGALFPLLVLTGTHYGLVPIGANNVMSLGYDSLVGPPNLASNIAQGGAALAVAIKTKQSEIKQLAYTSGITAVCGITEPALYGINVRFKTPLYAAMVGGAAGGAVIGIFGVRRFATGSPGLMTLPVYIGENGMSNFMYACLAAVVAFVVSFIVSFVLYQEKQLTDDIQELPQKEERQTVSTENATVYAPVSGEVKDLGKVNDPTFAQEIMGKGIAIVPNQSKILSPVKGKVTLVFSTKHAIGLRSEEGTEILIHVGLDTVKLDGKYFNALVETDQEVEVGTPLLEVDFEQVKAAGFDITIPIIVTNTSEYQEVLALTEGQVETGEVLIKAIK
ncbi:beta-glucoside-specific PTS transporter subunit IIABC [Streptococcus pasteurianus]|uniref:beta-glucoside-specific PTS transporter subunit IIABC n=1 Tax=Streptococcus pasteurianus TaxID=197614 RepID=UPI0030137E06